MAELAVVTGASRGIGLAISRALAERGLLVAMLAPASDRLAEAVATLGSRAVGVPCDVADRASVDVACSGLIASYGAPRVVVANAGIVRRGLVHELAPSDFDEVVAVNLRGTFLVAHALIGSMRAAGRGRFVAVASISSTLGTAGASAYNASKWGVVGFVKSLAEELRGTGVQAMALNPGSVDTDMLVGSGWSAQMTVEDVARLAVFASLDAPDAMNGSAIDMFGP